MKHLSFLKTVANEKRTNLSFVGNFNFNVQVNWVCFFLMSRILSPISKLEKLSVSASHSQATILNIFNINICIVQVVYSQSYRSLQRARPNRCSLR